MKVVWGNIHFQFLPQVIGSTFFLCGQNCNFDYRVPRTQGAAFFFGSVQYEPFLSFTFWRYIAKISCSCPACKWWFISHNLRNRVSGILLLLQPCKAIAISFPDWVIDHLTWRFLAFLLQILFLTTGTVFLTIVLNGSIAQFLLTLLGMGGLSHVEVWLLHFTVQFIVSKLLLKILFPFAVLVCYMISSKYCRFQIFSCFLNNLGKSIILFLVTSFFFYFFFPNRFSVTFACMSVILGNLNLKSTLKFMKLLVLFRIVECPICWGFNYHLKTVYFIFGCGSSWQLYLYHSLFLSDLLSFSLLTGSVITLFDNYFLCAKLFSLNRFIFFDGVIFFE